MATKNASPKNDEAPVLPKVKTENSIEDFLEKHGKKTMILILLAVIGVGVGFFMKARNQAYLKESGEKFTSAQTTAELEAVINDYPGSAASGNAMLILADRKLSTNNIADAQSYLKSFVEEQKDNPLYYNGLFALGTVEERLGNKDAATKIYRDIVAAKDKASTAAAAALRLADITYENGDLDAALSAYQALAKDFPGNVFIQENGVIDSRQTDVKESIVLRDNPPPAPEPPAEKPAPEAPASPTEKPAPEAPASPTEEPTPEAPASPTEEPAPEAPASPTEEPVPEAPASPTEEPAPEAPAPSE